jgi:hypothetical protein
MSGREELPKRRESDRLTFWHDGFQYTATFSRYPDGRLAELFFSVAKSGTALEGVARDAAILTSLCLQFGASSEAIRAALTRLEPSPDHPQGEPAGPVCRFLDILALGEGKAAA